MKITRSRPGSPMRRKFLGRSLGGAALLASGAATLPQMASTARAAAPTSDSAASNTRFSGVTLRYWDFLDPKVPGSRSEALRQIQENFTKRTGAGLSVEVMPYAQIEPNMIQAAATGRTPDVVRISVRALGLHVGAKTIRPLNDLAGNMPRDDWLLPWDTHVWNGQKMGMPIDNRATVLVYRKDYLEKAGARVPTSLDELGKTAALLTQGRVMGYMWGLSKLNRAAAFDEVFLSLYWSAGGGDPFENGKANFNSPAGVRVFQWLRDMVDKYHGLPKEAVSYDYEKMVDAIKSGVAAMAMFGTHRVVTTRQGGKLGDNLQTAPVPGFDSSKPAPANTSGWVYAIGKDSKNPQAAWAFIEHAVSQESQVINARSGGEVPSRKSTYDDPWFKTPEAAEILSWKRYIGDHGRSLKYPEKYLDGMEYLADEAAAVLLNNKPIQQALDDAARKYNAIA
jgi:multiple sugar transport system substrate-binding protein